MNYDRIDDSQINRYLTSNHSAYFSINGQSTHNGNNHIHTNQHQQQLQNNPQNAIYQLAQVGVLPPNSIRLYNQNNTNNSCSRSNNHNISHNNSSNTSCNFPNSSTSNNLNNNVCNISNKNINIIAAALNSSLHNNDDNNTSLLSSAISTESNDEHLEGPPWLMGTQDSGTQTDNANKLSNKINIPNHNKLNDFKVENVFLLCPCCNHKLKLSIDIKSDKTGIELISVGSDGASNCSGQTSKCNPMVSQARYEKDSVKMVLNNSTIRGCHQQQNKQHPNSKSVHNKGNKHFNKALFEPEINVVTGDVYKSKPKKRKRGERRIIKCNNKGCMQEFDTVQELNVHLQTHRTDVFECTWEGCTREFSKIEELCCHFRNSHSDKTKAFKCPCCDKAFIDAKQLRNHYRLHTDERPYSCDWNGCGARFRRCHHLTAHRRIHTGEKPYQCEFPDCNERFSKSFHLKKHHLNHISLDGSTNDDEMDGESAISLIAPISLNDH